jgi:hypothetical protein
VKEVFRDIQLIWDNCYKFNQPDSLIYKTAGVMQKQAKKIETAYYKGTLKDDTAKTEVDSLKPKPKILGKLQTPSKNKTKSKKNVKRIIHDVDEEEDEKTEEPKEKEDVAMDVNEEVQEAQVEQNEESLESKEVDEKSEESKDLQPCEENQENEIADNEKSDESEKCEESGNSRDTEKSFESEKPKEVLKMKPNIGKKKSNKKAAKKNKKSSKPNVENVNSDIDEKPKEKKPEKKSSSKKLPQKVKNLIEPEEITKAELTEKLDEIKESDTNTISEDDKKTIKEEKYANFNFRLSCDEKLAICHKYDKLRLKKKEEFIRYSEKFVKEACYIANNEKRLDLNLVNRSELSNLLSFFE